MTLREQYDAELAKADAARARGDVEAVIEHLDRIHDLGLMLKDRAQPMWLREQA